jgi:hypothetical protein
MVEDLSTSNAAMQNEFENQLQLLNQRGQLSNSEMKKIGDMNADLFGHSNNRQKIKYVSQLKEENVALKKVTLSLLTDLQPPMLSMKTGKHFGITTTG